VGRRMKISIDERHVIAPSDSSIKCCRVCHTNIINGEVKERKPSELEETEENSFSELEELVLLPD
jgi:hypothetical protein